MASKGRKKIEVSDPDFETVVHKWLDGCSYAGSESSDDLFVDDIVEENEANFVPSSDDEDSDCDLVTSNSTSECTVKKTMKAPSEMLWSKMPVNLPGKVGAQNIIKFNAGPRIRGEISLRCFQEIYYKRNYN
ncbi:hypothetical protein CHUAL_010754 [Chamberlinius hualienensis]